MQGATSHFYGTVAWKQARALGILAALAGCVTMTGPCQVDLDRQDDTLRLQCEAGGTAQVLAPANTGARLQAPRRRWRDAAPDASSAEESP